MWKVANNWVASCGNLFRKKCVVNLFVLYVKLKFESIEHILFQCSWTRAAWFGSGWSLWVFDGLIESSDKRMVKLYFVET